MFLVTRITATATKVDDTLHGRASDHTLQGAGECHGGAKEGMVLVERVALWSYLAWPWPEGTARQGW